jgi:3-deoxy-D-manno-octulosonic acid kinase
VAEARASAGVRARGIPTPRVVAGALYPRGLFYRADLVTEFVPASRDLADALFRGAEAERPDRPLLLEEAGRLLARMAREGVEHPDLNARTILLTREGGALVAMLLDLDRCRLRAAPLPPDRMLGRLERSLRKISGQQSVALQDADWNRLRCAALAA